MIQYFKNINGQTAEIERAEMGVWVNLVPPFKEEEFIQLADDLEIPIEFRFDTKPEDIARSFNVAIGGRFGLRLNSFTKVKYKDDGETIKVKDKRGLGLNDFRYGVYTRVGIGGFSFFGFYNLSEMFESGKGPHGRDINSLTVGISINGF